MTGQSCLFITSRPAPPPLLVTTRHHPALARVRQAGCHGEFLSSSSRSDFLLVCHFSCYFPLYIVRKMITTVSLCRSLGLSCLHLVVPVIPWSILDIQGRVPMNVVPYVRLQTKAITHDGSADWEEYKCLPANVKRQLLTVFWSLLGYPHISLACLSFLNNHLKSHRNFVC